MKAVKISRGNPQTLGFENFDASGLLNINALPHQLADNQLTIAQNVYGDCAGGLQMRRGMTTHGGLFSATVPGMGITRFYQEVVAGAQLSAILKFTLGQSGGTLWNVETNTQIGATNALGTLAQPWSVTRVNDGAIPTGSPTTGTISAITTGVSLTLPAGVTSVAYTISGTWVGTLSFQASTDNVNWVSIQDTANNGSYTGNVSSASSPFSFVNIGSYRYFRVEATAWTSGSANISLQPQAPTDILVICTGSGGPYYFDGANIGTQPQWTAQAPSAKWCQISNGTLWFSGIPSAPNSLVQMQIGAPSSWQQTYITSYPVTGLCVLGAGSQSGLFFGMTQGVGITFGVNSVDAYYQEIPHEDGVASARSCIAVNGLVYFLGNFNIYVFDGQNITAISKNVRPWIICDPNRTASTDFPMNGNRQLTSFSWYYNDFIYFAYDSGPVGYANTYLVWHLNEQGWTVLTGPKLADAALMNAPGDPYPIACVTVDAQKSQAYNWDVFNGSGPNNMGVDDAGNIITTNILTKFFQLAGHGTQSRLIGITPELFVTQCAGIIVVETDYYVVTPILDQVNAVPAANGLVWDMGTWDNYLWGGGGGWTFVAIPFQVDDTVGTGVPPTHTYAFGMKTSDKNPPYRWAGISGEFAIEGKSFSA